MPAFARLMKVLFRLNRQIESVLPVVEQTNLPLRLEIHGYPHFCVPGLKKREQDVTPPFHKGDWKTPSRNEPATSVSRRSNKLNPAVDTAAIKLTKVLDWIRKQ